MTTESLNNSSPVTAADFPEIRWHGNWIWCDPPAQGGFGPGMEISAETKEVHALFRKAFMLDEVPRRIPARITADSRYLLFCNGQEVFRGPIRSQPRRLSYDFFDLAPYLKAGRNVLAIYVKYFGKVKSYWMPAPTGMGNGQHTAQMVFEAKIGTDWLVSDETWKTHKSSAWDEDWRGGASLFFLEEGIPVEIFDARKFPFGWELPDFDDSAWGYASVMGAPMFGVMTGAKPPSEPYGPLYARPIAKLGGERRLPKTCTAQMLAGRVDLMLADPVKRLEATLNLPFLGEPAPVNTPCSIQLTLDTSARMILDLGRVVMGQVQFTIQAPAGTIVDLSYTEDPLRPPAGPFGGMHSGTRYYARGENDRFSVYDALGFRYANLLIHGIEGQVTLTDFAVQEDIYPWQPGAEFACSDDALNKIFQAGIRTVNLNARDAFTDCPTREQQAWVGDSVVHQMVSLVTNTDWRLAWHYLTLSDSPRSDGILPMTVVGAPEASNGLTIPDWSLHWVHGVYNLYRFSGDCERVAQFMPTVARVLRWFSPFQNQQGILEDIIEWALIDWSAVSVNGESAIYTAIWARGLREFAEMAAWLEERTSQKWAEGLYARVKAGFEIFWDEARGSYIDHIVDGEKRPEMSQLAGALAIVSGLAPIERWQRIIRTVTNPKNLVTRTWAFAEDDATGMPNMSGCRRYTWDTEKQVVRAEPFMSYVVHDAIAEAGLADNLTAIYHDWDRFLQGGYDTIGEDWTHGTHVHGWSCTPTKDMIFYTLGVTPAEPGYTRARIAPHLGGLEWIEAKVPTPHGLLWVRAEPGQVECDSPVPLVVELPGKEPVNLPAGKHTVVLPMV